MQLAHVEVLVEERSMEAVMWALMPRMIGSASFRIYPYQGKPALLRALPDRLRTYRRLLQPNWLVLVDRDGDDCHRLKRGLEWNPMQAGLATAASRSSGDIEVVNRIVVEELEAWYFGDWDAVCEAYPRVPNSIAARSGFRDPDRVPGGTWQALERILQRAGYFRGGLRKLELAQTIAPHMRPERNRSPSFQVLRRALSALHQP